MPGNSGKDKISDFEAEKHPVHFIVVPFRSGTYERQFRAAAR